MNDRFDSYFTKELKEALDPIKHSENLKGKIIDNVTKSNTDTLEFVSGKSSKDIWFNIHKKSILLCSSAFIGLLIIGILVTSSFFIPKDTALGSITLDTDSSKGIYVEYTLKDSKIPIEYAAKTGIEVIKKRLNGFGLKDANVVINNDKHIIITLDNHNNSADRSINTFKTLAARSEVLFYEVKSDKKSSYGYKKIGNPIIKSEDIRDAKVSLIDKVTGYPNVIVSFNQQGTSSFAAATKRLAESRGFIGIYVDGVLLDAVCVGESITNGTASIDGEFSRTKAEQLAASIKSGVLPVALDVVKTNL